MYTSHDKQTLFERTAKVKSGLVSRMNSCLPYLFPSGFFRNDQFFIGNIRGDKRKIIFLPGSKTL